MTENDLIENKKPQDTKLKKLGTIIITLLILLIPISFMFGIIHDRKDYNKEAIDSVASSWAKVQVIGRPKMSFKIQNGKKEETKYLNLNNYNVDIKVNTEIRKKGIFKVPVYTANVVINGDFINNYGNISNKLIETSFEVKDSRGFVSSPVFKINNTEQISNNTSVNTYIKTSPEVIPFEIRYDLRGLNEIYVVPSGENNNIDIQGNWKDPGFKGDFLPSTREITNENFNAHWTIPGIAASNTNNDSLAVNTGAGVSLIVPIDNYRMAERTLKYAFLFLSLTFLSYFIFELISDKNNKIHPLQYCLLGGAILVFYMLLTSMSEFMPFIISYLISALMVITLVFLYTYFVITKKENIGFAALISLIMAVLYTFLYTLLLMQDYSLLIGSFGLFVIIALIMYITRNIDWYNKGS